MSNITSFSVLGEAITQNASVVQCHQWTFDQSEFSSTAVTEVCSIKPEHVTFQITFATLSRNAFYEDVSMKTIKIQQRARILMAN